MNTNETIEKLEILKSAAVVVADQLEKEATALNSFTCLIDETIKLLKEGANND